MHIDTMRHIDRRAGIPLCFLMSLLLHIGKLFRRRRESVPDLSRTLFIELSEMGSAILVDPAMRYLRDGGGAELYFAIFRHNAESLDLLHTVPADHRFEMRADTLWHLAVDVVCFRRWCRKNKITTVIDLELYSRFTALLSLISGAGVRVGFHAHHDEGFYRGNFINYPLRYNAHVHISVNFMSLAYKAMGAFPSPYPTHAIDPSTLSLPLAAIDDSEREKVIATLGTLHPSWQKKRMIVFNINASDMLPQRKWLPEYFVEVARSLLAEVSDSIIVATGSSKEYKDVQDFVDAVDSDSCLNTAGMFTLRELIALYCLADCLLTNDSGPAHFASVTPLKTFVIFGPETPDLYLPLGNAEAFYLALPCSPCVSAANHRNTDCTTRECITGITPDIVSNNILKYLETIKN
ncbi:MAG: glycosyltransferase family 9 protein [Bacteroidales bacterium]|nr:glycosyltransferase family 9 protein [Bacteroidales bacterium]